MLLRRHLQSIAALPFVVTVVIPVWLARSKDIQLRFGQTPMTILAQVAGAVLLGLGVWMFLKSVRQFDREGRGTLAPWDPPRQLVINGLYRYVRNPMISGVCFIVLGEGLLLLSYPHLQYALLFFVINVIHIPLLEEPLLLRRFGDGYREYCRNVPRLIPRLSPWKGNESGS